MYYKRILLDGNISTYVGEGGGGGNSSDDYL